MKYYREFSLILAVSGLLLPSHAFAQEQEQEQAVEELVSEPNPSILKIDEEPEALDTHRPLITEEPPACRQETKKASPVGKLAGADRVFRGHRFLILSSQRSAFVMSSFNFEQSVFGLDIPKLAADSDGEIIHDVSTEGLGELLGFSLKVSKFMSVDAGAVMRIQHGPDAPSLLFRGAAYQIGGVLGATFQVFRDEDLGLQVSTRPWFSYTSSRNYSVFAFVDGASELAPDATPDEVLQTSTKDAFLEVTSEMSGGASLLLAYTWDEAVGVQASLDVAWSEQESDPISSEYGSVTKTEYVMVAGAGSIEYDFRSQGLPASFAAEYKMTYGRLADNPFPSTASRVSHRLGMGVYYTGRDDLQLGLAYYTLLGLPRVEAVDAQPSDPPRESSPAVVKMVAFNLYYFW
ncbi:MAG: hypothetical protein HOI23_18125 [Deltaproteobacteria bacterium]|nr:hypothetical protein [Deltaproteobacteria bacterium]MBT6436286.1 hypothetical protein [Deltaproteobacteria bacterium]MBT6492689.1 hypothetical protein [Deltaproteobacteria bacterium]